MWWVATFSMIDLEMKKMGGGFSGENAKRIGCVTVPEGVEGVLIQGFGW